MAPRPSLFSFFPLAVFFVQAPLFQLSTQAFSSYSFDGGAKCHDVTFSDVIFRAKASEREETAWVLSYYGMVFMALNASTCVTVSTPSKSLSGEHKLAFFNLR